MRTANYTDLRKNLKDYIDSVIDHTDTVVVNRPGGKGVVIISLEEYNALKETEYLSSSKAMLQAINKAEEEIKGGKGKTVELSELWK